ncbi:tyrosine--tRNA ligase, mitochondrial [Onthophagus taurus]|uniref:tyrosine--tRNA ligase, mitochondrial n=1 Tax=Onthophagus taurus TaxID=166361 RepID=UPI000C20B507|nr:tyrosine--tRNA ligase, mitochondrial [Onthophagus taurus]XP_022904282.1 tyrosine--tRNA ligase, mitochondrial [Onthophagus taurus]
MLRNSSILNVTIIKRWYSNRNMLKLKERGMFQELFPEISAGEVTDLLNAKPQTVYAGFDPTANSLHIGNLLVLVNLIHWQRGGHNVIALLGGATAKIGDPSGRTTEREQLQSVLIDENLSGIKKNIENVFNNHENLLWKEKDVLPKVRILNNEEWYNKMSPIQLIGNAGRFLRMGTLLSRTSVQNRLNSSTGMSFTEFSYQLFQAYDWLHLNKEFGCRFQIGGNDQMGNIMSGHDLISKTQKQSVYGLTLPLITTEEGDKFGKSAGNAIWITNDKTSPFSFYQFWVRQRDNDVEKFLKLFTFDTIGAISDLMRKHREKPELRLPQKYLAEQVTLLVHGEEGLKKANAATKALYEGSVAALSSMTVEEVAQLFQGATVVEVLPEAGQSILDLALKVKCFPTTSDAIRIITAGGFYVNQQRVSNPSEVITQSAHHLENNVTLLRVGKRNYYVIKWM